MPWKIEPNSAGKPCVILESTGETITCHDTQEEAQRHMAALYASESQKTGIEVDALKAAKSYSFSQPSIPTGERKVKHKEPAMFIAAPRTDETLLEKLGRVFKSSLKPGQTIFRGKDGKRGMFLITSNSYKDRDDETLTSGALQRYAESCWKDDGSFHSDNPLLFWHDDNLIMGEIVFTAFESPFLIEVAKEIDDPIAHVLWDFAEANGDNAGTSHRFGYLEEDRTEDGEFKDIVTKIETTYLPEKQFAANGLTYAGVIKAMDKAKETYFDKIFASFGGIEGASDELKKGKNALVKKLQAAGVNHKARKNKAEDDPEEEDDEKAEDTPPDMEEADEEDTKAGSLEDLAELVAAMQSLLMDMLDAQGGAVEAEMALKKEVTALKQVNATKEKSQSDLVKRIELLEARVKLTQRRASQDKETDPDTVKASIDDAIKSAEDAELVESPIFGKIKPSPYSTRNGS